MKNFFGRVLSTIVGNLLTFSILLLIFFGFLILLFFTSTSKTLKLKDNSILELSFQSPIVESEMDRSISIFEFSDGSSIYLDDIIQSIEYAKEDDKIKGISLKLDGFSGGLTQAEDIRDALVNFKESGKFIYAYSNSGNQLSYYINTVADTIYQNPLGGTLLQGLSSDVIFYKNAGDKYGIDFQVIRHGQFKSAVEPFLRTNMSEENKLQLSELLKDIWGNLENKIISSRKIPSDKFKEVVDNLYAYIPEMGKESNIYDILLQESDYQKILFSKLGIKEEKSKTDFETLQDHTVKIEDYISTISTEQPFSDDQIAVLYASGAITDGDGFEGVQSKTYVKAIREIAKNEKIKALVLRINSPGGSANASEEILYELKQLKAKKPIVVSFGDVAASGGYYIAQASSKIYAQPTTITGSIGVFGVFPSAKKLLNNIGLDFDGVQTNANSNQLKSQTTPMSETAKNIMNKSVVLVYNRFVNRVAENRKMTFDQVDKIGEGRVWSGISAKKIGLIDSFGNLDDAIKEAARLAKADEYSIDKFPKRGDSFNEIINKFKGYNLESVIRKELGTDGLKLYKEIKLMNEQTGIQLKLPYDIQIN